MKHFVIYSCVTIVLLHWTRSRGGWKFIFRQWWIPSDSVCGFTVILVPSTRCHYLLTYLLTYGC